jgi:hypothetical protein
MSTAKEEVRQLLDRVLTQDEVEHRMARWLEQ